MQGMGGRERGGVCMCVWVCIHLRTCARSADKVLRSTPGTVDKASPCMMVLLAVVLCICVCIMISVKVVVDV